MKVGDYVEVYGKIEGHSPEYVGFGKILRHSKRLPKAFVIYLHDLNCDRRVTEMFESDEFTWMNKITPEEYDKYMKGWKQDCKIMR